MLLEGLKLMGIGMSSVMLFLTIMILFIEFVKFLNRGFTIREKTNLEKNQDVHEQSTKSKIKKTLPVEVFTAAISAFESDQNQ